MESRIIVVDDELDFLESIRRGLATSGYKNVKIEIDPLNASRLIENGDIFDIALIDITMPGMNGIELLEVIRNCSPRTECIMVTAVDEAGIAVQCLRRGAYDYLVKPISKEILLSTLSRALERKRLLDVLALGKVTKVPKLNHKAAFKSIVTGSEIMHKILKEAELHATSDVPILITGETGTGKELLARAIHAASFRSSRNFTAINMDSLTGHLFDAEFFGYTKGAFTGAEKDRAGYLEYSNKGTLFLDEIGNLPLELQGKLLRVLQEGEFMKLGTSILQRTDIRFIAATNQDLENMLAKKQFRMDLYYRLKGGWLHLPALRERKDDIPLLISNFLSDFVGPGGANFEQDALSLLGSYDYPGNVRELKSIIQTAINLAEGRPIAVKHLPVQLRKHLPKAKKSTKSDAIAPLAEMERKYILHAYEQTACNKSRTARLLGISFNTLSRKLASYGIG